MPSRRTFVVIILCSAVVTSVWLLLRIPVKTTLISKSNTVNSESIIKIEDNENSNWEKILTDVDSKNEKVIDLTVGNDAIFDETTLTAQLARDLMSQYLLLKGNGGEVSQSEINEIADNVLKIPAYSKITGAVYLPSNLNIANNSNQATLSTYKVVMTSIIKSGFSKVKAPPELILQEAISTGDERILSALDPIIKANRTVIEDLLKVTVPKNASTLHLNLINSLSNTLVDIESMRVMFDDPMKTFGVLNQYGTHLLEFTNAINAMSSYLAMIK